MYKRQVGNEELLANALGVNAMNTKYMTFVLAGIFIGITAILQISYANSITTVSSLRSISMIFQPLMGVLIAFAIQEWCNLTLGVFISQFTLSMMFNALIALGVPSKMQDVDVYKRQLPDSPLPFLWETRKALSG